jgi:cytochrome c oxidase cbb3-type subunit 4
MSSQELSAYAYFATIVISVILLYYYIWYVHTDKRRGEDYEKFGNLAIRDSLQDDVIEELDNSNRDQKDPNEANTKKRVTHD